MCLNKEAVTLTRIFCKFVANIFTCQQSIAVLTLAHYASSFKGLGTILIGPSSEVPPQAAGLGRVQICLEMVRLINN